MNDWNSILLNNDAPQLPHFQAPSLLVVQDAPILAPVTPPQLFEEGVEPQVIVDEAMEHEPAHNE